MKKKNTTNNSKPKSHEPIFKNGDYVGAKVKGHPVWPGFIEDVKIQPNNRRKYTVRFFGSNDKAVNFQELKFFHQMTASELSCKKKGFQEALALCREQLNSKGPVRKKTEPKSISNLHCVDDQAGDRVAKLKKSKLDLDVKSDRLGKADEGLKDLKPKQDTELDVKIEKEDDDEEDATPLQITTIISPNVSINDERPCRSPLVQPSQTNGVEDAQLKNTNIDLKTKSHRAKSRISKTGEENVMQLLTERDTIIAKIQRKVLAKLREKETCKQKKKYKRLGEKASEKYPIIESRLIELSSAFVKLSEAKGQIDLVKWNITVRTYNALLPILEKYIKKYFMTEHSNSYRERKECKATLLKLVETMKKAKKKDYLSQLKFEIKRMLREMRKHQVLRDFINGKTYGVENSKNAMTERNAVELSCS